MEKKSYYAIIPANVRYSAALQSGAKLLYGEITALCNEKGYCWASNAYFSDLYEVDARTIRRWINSLEAAKFIKTQVKGTDRMIWLVEADKNVRLPRTKMSAYPGQKCPHNNTYNNTDEMKTSSKFSPSGNPKRMDDVTYGDPETGESSPGPKTFKKEGKNKIAMRVQAKFAAMCEKQIGTKPISDIKTYQIALFALNTGGLTETQIYDLFEEWFLLGRPDEETISMTRALSGRQIEQYKIRNSVK